MRSLKHYLKKITGLRILYRIYLVVRNEHSFFKKIKLLKSYFVDYQKYKKLKQNMAFKLSLKNIAPCIFDKTTFTPIEPTYFLQDAWCARKICQNNPKQHYDIGSGAKMISIISQFIPTTMIDIRPIKLELSNLSFIKGDILNLPFQDNSIESLSSICVIEHIGLGRYGDKFDAFGSEKTFSELKRVLAPNGSLYISLPVDDENKIYFNAHRSFNRDYMMQLSNPLTLVEEKYIYGQKLCNEYDQTRGFGTGLFYFKKV